jgi:hypothetical protein
MSTRTNRNRRYLREGRVGLLLGFILVILFGLATRNILFGLLSFFVVFVLPYLGWAAFADGLAVNIARYLLVRRVLDRVLPNVLRKRLPQTYFRAATTYPAHLWGRFLQVLFLTFFLSTLTIQYAPPIIIPATSLSRLAEFALYGLLFVTVAGPVVGIVWIYEDWGLRGINRDRGVSNPVGSTIVGYLSGFGTIGTFASFILKLTQNSILGAMGDTLLLLFLLVPPCLIVSAIFHTQKEAEIHAKLSRNAELSEAIVQGSLVVSPAQSTNQ